MRLAFQASPPRHQNWHSLSDLGLVECGLLLTQQFLKRLQASVFDVFWYVSKHFRRRGAGAGEYLKEYAIA